LRSDILYLHLKFFSFWYDQTAKIGLISLSSMQCKSELFDNFENPVYYLLSQVS
jgi:hypothetical protein